MVVVLYAYFISMRKFIYCKHMVFVFISEKGCFYVANFLFNLMPRFSLHLLRPCLMKRLLRKLVSMGDMVEKY